MLLAACAAPQPAPPAALPAPPVRVPTPLPRTPGVAVLSAPAVVAPLADVLVQLRAPGRDGAATLELTDAHGTVVGNWPVMLQAGVASLTVLPRGAPGPQRAVVRVGETIIARADPLFTLDPQTSITTGQPRIDELYPRIRAFMEQCVLEYPIDGVRVRGYRSPDNPLLWLRDHSYQSRGFRYFETDVTSLIDAFRRAQRPDGSLPDFLARRAAGVLAAGRKEVEADVEYLFVLAVYDAWQATGDDAWLRTNLAPMRRALVYTMSDPLRWDAARQLVKRPYTLDTWDFSYGPTTQDPTNGRPAPRHWIDDTTIWGIFHGDNTGLAFALERLALIEDRVGDPTRAVQARTDAAGIIERLNALSWNGAFYTHFVPLEPFDAPGVDESRQLSLSNTFVLNRDLLTRQQGRAVVDEYFARGQLRGTTFAEWYSIDPPFPSGSYGLNGRPGEQPGEYVNGGIMPLVGGELARGAFRYGAEAYGFATLHRYHYLISSTGATYLWYYPEGNPGISGVDTIATDGWGASAMLAALIEGAAGVEDRAARFRDLRISPRWAAATDLTNAHVVVRYAASDAYVAYRWRLAPGQITIDLAGDADQRELRVLLPAGAGAISNVTADDTPIAFTEEDRFGSRYVVVDASGHQRVTVAFAYAR